MRASLAPTEPQGEWMREDTSKTVERSQPTVRKPVDHRDSRLDMEGLSSCAEHGVPFRSSDDGFR